jgi:hypothetical protein
MDSSRAGVEGDVGGRTGGDAGYFGVESAEGRRIRQREEQ